MDNNIDTRISWTPFMKQIIDNIRKTIYKKLKVAVTDKKEWRLIEVIEPIEG